MSYLEQYQNRITNLLDGVEEMAVIFAATDKLPVDYEVWSKTYLSKTFDLDSRGLRSVFRTLSDRIRQGNLSLTNKSKQWSSPTDKVCAYIVPLIRDAFEKARVMTLGYLETVELLSGPKASWVEILRNIGFYFALSISDELEEFLKFQTASLCALALSNQTDASPTVVKRGRWRVGDFIPYCTRVTWWIRKQCIQRRTPKATQLAFSIYATKRIAPAVSDNVVEQAMEKNLKALTTERSLPDVIRLADQIDRTVDELFNYSVRPEVNYDTPTSSAQLRNKLLRAKRLRADTHHQKIPSLSACYEVTRSKGGALQCLLRNLNLMKGSEQFSDGEIIVCIRPLLGYATRKDRFVQPVPVYGVLCEEDQKDLMQPSRDGWGTGVYVRREPILEPFKVRVISKGEAVPYQISQNYQPFLWNLLQLCECFSLTGRPLENLDLERVLNFGKSSGQHCQIVSGDYSAATDNLHPWLSEVCLRRIVKKFKIPFEDALILKSCLTGHLIDDRTADEYRRNKGKLGRTGKVYDDDLTLPSDRHVDEKQIWGQLMGSPISFPILCIINAAVTRDALERSFGRTITLKDGAFLINGDDVIFTIPSGQYQNWVHNVTLAGLSPSPGKNYVSRRYGVINSQLFDCGETWDYSCSAVTVKQVPILKMNLVYCTQHTSTERRKNASLFIGEALRHGKTLEGRMNELIKGWDVEFRDVLLKRAYHYAKPHLLTLPPVSWVLPKCLGGLGLPATSDHVVAEHHLKLAAMIVCLDSETRRDVINLQWMREPGNVFCEETNSQLNEIYDELQIRTVLSTSKCADSLYSPLIRSNLGYGVDTSVIDPQQTLTKWKRLYQSWMKRVHNVKWTKSTEHLAPGLHMMTMEHAMSLNDKVWTREFSATLS